MKLGKFVGVLGFYFSPTAKVKQRQGLSLKHTKDWRSPGSNPQSLVHNASGFTTTPCRLLYLKLDMHWPKSLKTRNGEII